mgnify:FL=1
MVGVVLVFILLLSFVYCLLRDVSCRLQQMLKDAQAQNHILSGRVDAVTGEQAELFKYLKDAGVQLPKRFYLSAGATMSASTSCVSGRSGSKLRPGCAATARPEVASKPRGGKAVAADRRGGAAEGTVESIPVRDTFSRTGSRSGASDLRGDSVGDVFDDGYEGGYGCGDDNMDEDQSDHGAEQGHEYHEDWQGREPDSFDDNDNVSSSSAGDVALTAGNSTNNANNSLAQLLFDKRGKHGSTSAATATTCTTSRPTTAGISTAAATASPTKHTVPSVSSPSAAALKNMNLVATSGSGNEWKAVAKYPPSIPVPRASGPPKVTTYRNGTNKEIFTNGDVIVRFTNGDVKLTIAADSTIVYYYAEAQTTHTAFGTGDEKYQFANGQVSC